MDPAEHPPVFVHAWWRSSTTYLRRKLQANEHLCCFEEPLHEVIGMLNPRIVGAPVDMDAVQRLHHPISTKNYYAEYGPLIGRDTGWRKPFSYDRYYLNPRDSDPELEDYLRHLIESARARGKRPVLCFCRSSLRAAWMKQRFDGRHLALLRDPREQWSSMLEQHRLGGTYFLAGVLAIAARLRARFPRAFAHLNCDLPDHRADTYNPGELGRYIELAKSYRIYELYGIFILVWLTSVLQTLGVADIALDVSHLSTDLPTRKRALERLGAEGLAVDFSDLATPQYLRLPLAAEALESLEFGAARALARNALGLVITSPRQVEMHAPNLGPRTRELVTLALRLLPRSRNTGRTGVQGGVGREHASER